MVAATCTEQAVAKIFSNSWCNWTIVNGMIKETTSNMPAEKLRHQPVRRERIELHLQKQPEASVETRSSATQSEKLLSHKVTDAESDDSDYDGIEVPIQSVDEMKYQLEAIFSDVEAAKTFLRTGDAFARLKEEFEDFVHPFNNDRMWTKTLWDGDEKVRFELSHNVPRLTNVDKLKLAAEEILGMPIIWWPFRQPKNHLPSSKIRVIWLCVCQQYNHCLRELLIWNVQDCNQETHVEVSCAKAQRYRRMCTTTASIRNHPILPTSNQSTTGSTGNQGLKAATSRLLGDISNTFQLRSSPTRGPSRPIPTPKEASNIVSEGTPGTKIIHWCVDSADRRTFLHNICLEKKKGRDFIVELCKSYRKLRGWKWLFSMTTCAEIKIVKASSQIWPHLRRC